MDYNSERPERQATDDNQVVYVQEPVWIMEDGSAIRVRDMSSKHIKTCIHMIYRTNGSWRTPYLRIFENELRRRKFQAGSDFDVDDKEIGRIVARALKTHNV